MNLCEAKNAVQKFITSENAEKYVMLETDHMIWVEANIMDAAGIQSSVNTDFGETICVWIELNLKDKYYGN
jgi:hypothetical protein